MTLPPTVYANLLGEKIAQHKVNVWLINTGWTGGPYGVGSRMKLGYTRAMIHAALDGGLTDVPMEIDPIFGLAVPTACPNVPSEVLNQRSTWAAPAAYDVQAKKLATMFAKNFENFADKVTPEVRAAGPQA